ncbi:MAG: TlpA disulfide reductase family protein [Planctomycetota bacterium]
MPTNMFLILFTLATAFSLVPSQAFADPADQGVLQEDFGTVHGRVALPDEAPDWFRGGELNPSRVTVVLEERYKRPALDLPEGYREWTREQKAAWQREFVGTDAYKEYMAALEDARRNALRIPIKVNADGTFKAEDIKPGGYNIAAAILHEDGKLDELAKQSWASGRTRPELVEAGETYDLGTISLRIQNVLMPGDQAPQWTARSYDGEEIKLSDFLGKYVLIDFWATWCGPCIAEIPNLETVYTDYSGDQFEMIGLSLDANIGIPKDFHKEKPSAYVHAYLGEFNKTETATRAYGVIGIPSIWLIGPDGKVIARDLRGDRLREAVRMALEDEPQAH